MKEHVLKINGKVVTREEFEAHPKIGGEGMPLVSHAYDSANPLRSISMGCHPEQVAMLNEEVRKEGISGVHYDREGNCMITSRKGRAAWAPKFGERVGLSNVHDSDGGYSDG